MLDKETLKRSGGDGAIPFTLIGQSLQFFGGRAHETAAIDSIQVFGRWLREQAAIIHTHETERGRYPVHDLFLEILTVLQ